MWNCDLHWDPRVTNINFLLTKSVHDQEKRLWELIKINGNQRRNALMFYQICSIISSRKWMEINLENFSGGSREGPFPLIFRPNWGPREKKKILRPLPPLSQGLDDRWPRPLHYLKVWICHWICTWIWGLSRVYGTSSSENKGQSVGLGEKAQQKFSSTKCHVKLCTG